MVNNKFINYFVIFSFFGLWSSIGSDPYNFLYIFEKKNILDVNISNIDLKNLFNLLRAAFPLFCLICSSVIIVKYKLFKKQKKFIYLLLVVQIIQILSTFFSRGTIISNYEDSIDHIGRYHWIISSIALIFIFMISTKLKNFEIKILFYISTFFLVVMVIWFSARLIIDFYGLNIVTSLYNINIYRESAYFLNHEMPRVTGLSRSIIFLYIITFYITQNLNKTFKYFRYILLSVLGAFIFLFQSKFALISFFIVNFIFIFNFKNKFKGGIIILTLIIIQMILFYSISSSRIIYNIMSQKNTISKDHKKVKETDSKIKKDEVSIYEIPILWHYRTHDDPALWQYNSDNINIKKKQRHLRKIFPNPNIKGMDLFNHIIFSGRLTLWIKSINYIIERPILGYGSMSDRIILNKKQLKNNQMVHPVSNAFLYAFISGGIFSLIFFLYFWINIRMKITNIFKFNINENIENKVSSLLLLLILLRCFVENSIMLFGVDFLLLLNSIYLTSNK